MPSKIRAAIRDSTKRVSVEIEITKKGEICWLAFLRRVNNDAYKIVDARTRINPVYGFIRQF